jgi:CheY-like chemotaxis protein
VQVGASDGQGGGSPAQTSAFLGSARVLFADDQDVNRELAKVQFDQIGLKNLVLVADGKEAFEACQKEKFDIIFLDIQMPVMDGLEAAVKIRSLRGDFDKVPIIINTATTSPEVHEECMQAGATEIYMKPTRVRTLAEALQKYLGS